MHKPNCLSVVEKDCDQLETREFLTVSIFKHSPPRVDGCPLDDS